MCAILLKFRHIDDFLLARKIKCFRATATFKSQNAICQLNKYKGSQGIKCNKMSGWSI